MIEATLCLLAGPAVVILMLILTFHFLYLSSIKEKLEDNRDRLSRMERSIEDIQSRIKYGDWKR